MPAQGTVTPPTLDDCQAVIEDPRPRTIVVTGRTGAGKTTLAATLFADLTDTLSGATAKNITLDGAVWLLSDDQGLVSLTVDKIRPQYVIDLRALLSRADGDMGQVLRWALRLLIEAKDAGASGVVWDTVTSLGAMLERWYVHGGGCPMTTRGADTRGGWGLIGNKYFELFDSILALGYRQVILAQPKANGVEEAADERGASQWDKAKAVVSGTAGENLIIPAVSGQSFYRVLMAQCSLSGWLRAEDVKGQRQYAWMPYGGDGSQSKNRYARILDRIEPADLAAMDKKILAAVHG